MKCFGRTKESNYRNRCTRETSFLLCWQHAWQPFAAIVAVVLFFAALSEFTGFSLKDFFSKSLPAPDIICTMEYPIKTENNKAFRDKSFPEIVVTNKGPVSALSVSGRVILYDYDSNKDEIIGVGYNCYEGFDHAFAEKELVPFDKIRQLLTSYVGENKIVIYDVSVTYYVGEERKRYHLKKRFFVENGVIRDDKQFKNDSRYINILKKLDNIDPLNLNGAMVKITNATENAALVETKGIVSIQKDNDGKVVLVPRPEDQGEVKKEGYPFLVLKPYPFKSSGFSTKSEIFDSYVEVKTQFAVTNTGDAMAMITEDGFEVVEIIMPGETKYYTITSKEVWKKGIDKPLEDLVKHIDESENYFEIKFDIRYRPANDTKIFLKVTGHYSIGKHKVIEIKKGTNP